MADLRYAIRSLLKSPGFAAAAILTIALGIAANTAIFTMVNAVILRPLPYANADRLVMLWQDMTLKGGPPDEWATPGNFVDWQTYLDGVESLAAIMGWRPTLTGAFEAESLVGEQISYEYFRTLGVRPAFGRDFEARDDAPGAARVTVIADELWRRRFAASPTAIGQAITLAGEAHEIVGVLPPGFRPVVAAGAEIWRPLRLNRANPSRGAIVLRIVARLADGISVTSAQTEAAQLAARLQKEQRQFNDRVAFAVQPLHERAVGEIRPGLLALWWAVALVLLIACANVANLLMARGSHRGRELAVRATLGAGRVRVIRQLLTESLVLAAIGGAIGLLISFWTVAVLLAWAPASIPRLEEVSFDWRVFAFTSVLVILTGVVFGLGPALRHGRTDGWQVLKSGGRGVTGAADRVSRRALVAAEVALALVLLAGGAMLLQTFARLQAADLGFRTDGLLTGGINPPRASYDGRTKLVTLYDHLLETVRAIPGVRQAALASVLPFAAGDSDMSFQVVGRPAPGPGEDVPVAWYRQVSAGYFDIMGVRLIRGRGFTDREATPSTVVNQTFVRRYFPADNPVGQQIRFGGPDDPAFTIVGIVADVKGRGPRAETQAEIFLPYWQLPEGGMQIVLRGDTPGSFAAPLRQAVASIDPNLPIVGVRTMEDALGESVSQPRFLAALAGAFAVVALVLAGVGIYGVMAYTVAQRTSEIGVRMAVGASRSNIFRLVIGEGLLQSAVGIGVGVAGVVAIGQWLSALLFEVSPMDPAVVSGAAAVLVVVAITASAIPAWRATRVDPVRAVSSEIG